MNTNTSEKLIEAIYGKGYQEGLPELPSDPTDGRYYWRPAKPNDKASFQDRAGNLWVVTFEWVWEQ